MKQEQRNLKLSTFLASLCKGHYPTRCHSQTLAKTLQGKQQICQILCMLCRCKEYCRSKMAG